VSRDNRDKLKKPDSASMRLVVDL